MSFQITEAFVKQYRNNVLTLSQQKGSKLRPAVLVETGIVGKSKFFERIGKVAATKRTSRHGDTPLEETPHSRRMVNLETYEWADLIDNADKVRMLIDPKSEYVNAGVNAMGRAIDLAIIAAASGNAYSGEDGQTPVALSGDQKIPHGSASLTLAKVAAAKRILDSADVDPDEPRFMVVAPKQIEYLLVNVNEVRSSDYVTVHNLMKGEINQYYGFTWILSNLLTLATYRYCLAFAKSGLALGIGQEIKTDIDKRPDKSNSTQVYVSMDIGATRVECEKIVEIECTES